MVIDDIGELSMFHPRHWPEAVWLEEPVDRARPRDNIAVPEEILAVPRALLEYPPPERIIAVAPAAVRTIGQDKLILRVPPERPGLRAEALARYRPPHHPATGVLLQRDDLTMRAVRDADNTRRRGLPVQKAVGVPSGRGDVEVRGISETLGAAVAIFLASDRAVNIKPKPLMRCPIGIVEFFKENLPNVCV